MLAGQFRKRKQHVENRRNMSFFGCQKAQQSEWEAVYRHLWISWTRFNATSPRQRFLNTEDDKPIGVYVINILCVTLNKSQRCKGPKLNIIQNSWCGYRSTLKAFYSSFFFPVSFTIILTLLETCRDILCIQETVWPSYALFWWE